MATNESEERKETPAERWGREIEASGNMLKKFHKQGDQVNNRFIDDRKNTGTDYSATSKTNSQFRLNLFHSNIVTQRSMLFGKIPKVDVARKFADSDDDQARVGGEMLGRMLNNSVEDPGEGISDVLRHALDDRLIVGLGQARVRYEYEADMQPKLDAMGQPELDEDQQPIVEEAGIKWEGAPIDYVHWRDFRWSWSRVWKDLRWMAYRSYFTKEDMTTRFNEDIANDAVYKKREVHSKETTTEDSDLTSETEEAEVWEIWCESENRVYWWTEGPDTLCDEQEDPLQLDSFYPSAPPMVSNVTTSLFVPKPDFCMAQDLYNEIDTLETRIAVITTAIRVVGVYDKQVGELQRMLKEGNENQLIPVDSWAVLSEKGGLKGCIDWFPIADVVSALLELRQLRDDNIALLYQITGLSDIMRGASEQYTSASSDKLKAKFGSVRIQAMQDEFAMFASNIMRLKAEVINKHFQPETIIEQSNIMYTADKEMAQQGVELIKSPQFLFWRIEVRAESVAMVDYAQLKAERTEYLVALSTFLQAGTGMIKEAPEAGPVLVQLLKWGLAGFKGSSEIEGVIDKALDQMMKNPPQGKKDPAADKAKADAQKEQMKHELKMKEIQTKHKLDMKEMLTDFKMDIQKLLIGGELDVAQETAQATEAIRQATGEGDVELQVETGKAEIGLQSERGKAAVVLYADIIKADKTDDKK